MKHKSVHDSFFIMKCHKHMPQCLWIANAMKYIEYKTNLKSTDVWMTVEQYHLTFAYTLESFFESLFESKFSRVLGIESLWLSKATFARYDKAKQLSIFSIGKQSPNTWLLVTQTYQVNVWKRIREIHGHVNKQLTNHSSAKEREIAEE